MSVAANTEVVHGLDLTWFPLGQLVGRVAALLRKPHRAGNIEGALALMDDQAVYWVSGKPEQFPLAGNYDKQEFVQMLGRIGSAMPNGVEVNITSATAQEDRVTVEAEAHGISAAGKVYDNRLIYAFELRAGQIL
jgi:uncharacterized protein